jgi:hypothetical protein
VIRTLDGGSSRRASFRLATSAFWSELSWIEDDDIVYPTSLREVAKAPTSAAAAA